MAELYPKSASNPTVWSLICAFIIPKVAEYEPRTRDDREAVERERQRVEEEGLGARNDFAKRMLVSYSPLCKRASLLA